MHRIDLLLFSLVATFVTSLLFAAKANTLGFIDLPEARKVHINPTPRTGGISMVVGGGAVFLISVYLGLIPFPLLPWQTWSAGIGFVSLGILDDRFSFAPNRKFFIFLLLSILAAWPWVQVLRIEIFAPWIPKIWLRSAPMQLIACLVLTFWFMAVPNSVNIEDAINGYMGGFTLLIMIGLYSNGVDTQIAIGALLGFLLLNWPNARHFMGDAGSFGCGFFIAESIVRGGGLRNPLMALSFTAPISLDVAIGLIRRKRLGMSSFAADRATLPHHILQLTNGNGRLAALILWTNAAGFIFLVGHLWVILALLVGNISVLVFLNRKALFSLTTPI